MSKVSRFLGNLNVFKKKKSKKPVWVSSKRKDRRVHITRRKISLFFKVIFNEILKNKYAKIFISVAFICILVIFGRYFLFSSNFNIKHLYIEGCENVERDLIFNRLERIIDKNIFFIRSSSLKDEISNYSAYISEVKVEKHLPDSVYVNIDEREPLFVWVNLSGAYLVSQEGLILEVVADFRDLEISSEDIDLLKGYGNLKEYTVSEEDEDGEGDTDEGEENESIDEESNVEEEVDEQEQLSDEEILELIEQERDEIIARVDQYWNENMVNIPEKFQAYTFVLSYDQKSYVSLDSLSEEILDNTRVGLDINFIGETVHRYIWESEYRFVFYFDVRRKIVFSTRRDFSTQSEDLRVLIDKLKKDDKRFSYIDLSSDIIVYEVEE